MEKTRMNVREVRMEILGLAKTLLEVSQRAAALKSKVLESHEYAAAEAEYNANDKLELHDVHPAWNWLGALDELQRDALEVAGGLIRDATPRGAGATRTRRTTRTPRKATA